MAKGGLRPFNAKSKTVRLPALPPYAIKAFNPGRVALEESVDAGLISAEDLPADFLKWHEFEDQAHYVFLSPKTRWPPAIVEMIVNDAGEDRDCPVKVISADREGEDVAAVLVERDFAKRAMRRLNQQLKESIRSSTPRAHLLDSLSPEQRKTAEEVLVGEPWGTAEKSGQNFFHWHGRAVAASPTLAETTSKLYEEIEGTGCSFLEIADHICYGLVSTSLFAIDWKPRVRRGFSKLSPKTKQRIGAAVGVITSSSSPFPMAEKKRVARTWERIVSGSVDKAYLAALSEAERKFGGPLLTATDAGEHKSSRPVLTSLIVTTVDTLLKRGVSKRRACDLTDRLLLLLVRDWYDHEKPSWSRVRARYDYAKKRGERKAHRRQKAK